MVVLFVAVTVGCAFEFELVVDGRHVRSLSCGSSCHRDGGSPGAVGAHAFEDHQLCHARGVRWIHLVPNQKSSVSFRRGNNKVKSSDYTQDSAAHQSVHAGKSQLVRDV